jgi:hypothetical protein
MARGAEAYGLYQDILDFEDAAREDKSAGGNAFKAVLAVLNLLP